MVDVEYCLRKHWNCSFLNTRILHPLSQCLNPGDGKIRYEGTVYEFDKIIMLLGSQVLDKDGSLYYFTLCKKYLAGSHSKTQTYLPSPICIEQCIYRRNI